VIYQSRSRCSCQGKSGDETKHSPVSFTITKTGELMWDHDRSNWQTLNQKLRLSGLQ